MYSLINLRKTCNGFFRKYCGGIFLVLAGVSVFLLGATIGTAVEKHHMTQSLPGIVPTSFATPEIPLIFLERIENGVLFGRNEGREVRFVVGTSQEEIFPEFDGDFSFSVIDILPNLAMIPAPTDMQFVASKRGKKFWPLDAPEAALIPPKNRTFFRSATEAREKGFEKGE